MKIESLGFGVYRLHLNGSTYTITGFVACWSLAWQLRGAKR